MSEVDRIHRRIAESREMQCQIPARLAIAGAPGTSLRFADLDGDLAAGDEATATTLRWNGTNFEISGSLTVRDWRESGDDIVADTRVLIAKINGAWWVIQAACP